MKYYSKFVVAGAVLLGSAIGGSAFAGSQSGQSDRSQSERFAALEANPVTTIDYLRSTGADLWSRSRDASDTPSVEVLGSAAIERGGSANDARLLRTVEGTKVYVTPVQGGICLSSDNYVVSTCLPQAALPKSTGDDALGGLQGVSCSPYIDENQMVFSGLVANDLADVRFHFSDGTVQRAPVVDGFVLFRVSRNGPVVQKLSWVDADGGVHSVPSPLPPGAENDRCVRSNPAAAVKAEKAYIREQVSSGALGVR